MHIIGHGNFAISVLLKKSYCHTDIGLNIPVFSVYHSVNRTALTCMCNNFSHVLPSTLLPQ